MESRPEDLQVRRHERVKCELRAQISAAPDSERQVRLARTLGDGSRIITASVIDASPGGLGINSTVYFPRASVVHVRITAGDDPKRPPVFEGDLRVQRASMIDAGPTYYLGTSFAERPDEASVTRLLSEAAKHPMTPPGAKGAAVA